VSKAHIHQKHLRPCETSTHFKPHSVSGMRSAGKLPRVTFVHSSGWTSRKISASASGGPPFSYSSEPDIVLLGFIDKGDCTPSLSYHRFKLVTALALTNKSPNFILSTYNSTSLTSPTQTSWQLCQNRHSPCSLPHTTPRTLLDIQIPMSSSLLVPST
jgi:hypothetical protein